MTKTILDLCQSLPDSEPELRARADEFNLAVLCAVFGVNIAREIAPGDFAPLSSIADAKAATDALKACCIFRVTVYGDLSCTATAQIWEVSADNDGAWVEKKEEVEVEASAEELARSACALLAANALSA